ncbi:uncharacterized protein KY384_008254 [Bacidia gigantensis]|uniref:uncharacterized protein n=1 Tax=Bacidia gigantensis TaxID=2732470 RepID=UPI001D059426|nr:uncharacterized protein KY384_008254 [Bacidia gigantensis]KAG8526825.1 hypothetical protein KY384_008254 [Bacidia gigantensis]
MSLNWTDLSRCQKHSAMEMPCRIYDAARARDLAKRDPAWHSGETRPSKAKNCPLLWNFSRKNCGRAKTPRRQQSLAGSPGTRSSQRSKLPVTPIKMTEEKSRGFLIACARMPIYSSIGSASCPMVTMAARTTSEIRRIIYETLASIPDALTHASTYIEIYNAHSSEALVEKTAALCKCILVLLQLIVRFFLKGSFKRGVTAVLKGSAFEDELKNSVQDMKNHVLKLREEANLCLQKRIAEMDRKNDLRECRGISHLGNQLRICANSTEQTRQQLAKGELLLAIESSAKVTAETVCTYLLRQLQATPDFNVRTGSLSPQFATSLQIANEATLRPEIVAQETVSPTPEDLLAMLEYDNTSQQKDIEYSLTLGYTQSDAAHARSTWVLQSPEMGEFLAGKAGSRLLLINGNGEAIEFISPLSFVCAKISDLINLSHQIILATHFCGHHTDELRDPRANVQGMLTSLVGQLLTHVKRWERSDFRLDLSSISDDKCNAIQQEDKDALFDLFRAIIMQLPKNTIIFCLIDGLSAYENSNRKKDTIAFMRKLARLVQKSSRVALRVLVTFPGQSIYADHWRGFDGKKAKMLYVPTDL